MKLLLYVFNKCSISIFTGTRFRVESEIQGGQIHNRTGAHGERERVGLGAASLTRPAGGLAPTSTRPTEPEPTDCGLRPHPMNSYSAVM